MFKTLVISATLATLLAACQPNTTPIDRVEFQKSFESCTAQGLTMGTDAHKQCTFESYANKQI